MNRNTAARTARIEDAAPGSAAPSSAAPGSAVPAFAAHSSALPDSTAPRELSLALLPEIPFCTSSDILLSDPLRPAETPSEEFRTLRTRLEQMQATRAIQTVLVASPSAGEGKSFTAANLALAQAQLADNPTLLCDFDLRNPILHRVFQIGRAPGISDYLLGKASLHQVVRRIENRNLFVLPAGEAAINPLELLHLKEVRELMGALRRAFRWIVLDSPPLLAASDANLLVALADGTLLVTRLGGTTIDAMGRAIASLGRPNLLGIVANCTGPSRL
jgi:receptor protein-tyrosine kinase